MLTCTRLLWPRSAAAFVQVKHRAEPRSLAGSVAGGDEPPPSAAEATARRRADREAASTQLREQVQRRPAQQLRSSVTPSDTHLPGGFTRQNKV